MSDTNIPNALDAFVRQESTGFSTVGSTATGDGRLLEPIPENNSILTLMGMEQVVPKQASEDDENSQSTRLSKMTIQSKVALTCVNAMKRYVQGVEQVIPKPARHATGTLFSWGEKFIASLSYRKQIPEMRFTDPEFVEMFLSPPSVHKLNAETNLDDDVDINNLKQDLGDHLSQHDFHSKKFEQLTEIHKGFLYATARVERKMKEHKAGRDSHENYVNQQKEEIVKKEEGVYVGRYLTNTPVEQRAWAKPESTPEIVCKCLGLTTDGKWEALTLTETEEKYQIMNVMGWDKNGSSSPDFGSQLKRKNFLGERGRRETLEEYKARLQKELRYTPAQPKMTDDETLASLEAQVALMKAKIESKKRRRDGSGDEEEKDGGQVA